MKRLLILAALAGACAGSTAQTPTAAPPATAEQKRAPDFTLVDTDGKPVALHDLLKNGTVILAFFPKAFTGGCTKEMTAYRDRYTKIQEKGAQIVGISVDDPDTLKKFKESLGAPFPMLSDPQGKVASQYGGVMDEGYAKRATFVVNPDGTIGHTEEGMAAIIPDAAVEACSKKTTI